MRDKAATRGSTLFQDRTGATSAEYVIVVALVALGALGAFVLLGDSVAEQVSCAAGAIGGSGSPCGVPDGAALGTTADASRSAGETAAGGGDARATAAALSDSMEGYESSLDSALGALASDFGAFSGGDDRVTTADLERARSSTDPDVHAAASRLLDDPAALNALDVGSGRGDVDGEISREDVDGFTHTLREGDLVEALADTASGGGGRDHHASRDDLLALAGDESVPSEVRDEARTRAEAMPEGDGCGNIFCSAWHGWTGAADWVWDVAADAVSWSASFGQRLTWLAGFPMLGPGQLDDFLTFRANLGLGVVDWFVNTGKGLYGVGKWLVERQAHSWDALFHGDVGTFVMTQTGADLIDDIPKVWDGVTAIASGLWHQIDTFAVGEPDEAGRAGGSLAMDVASVVVPGAIMTKGARGAAVAAVAEDATAAEVVTTAAVAAEVAEVGSKVRFFDLIRPTINPVSGAAAPLEARAAIAAGLEQLPDDVARALVDNGWTIKLEQGASNGSMFIRSRPLASGGMTGELGLFVGADGSLPPLSGATVEQYLRTALNREVAGGTPGSYLSAEWALTQDGIRAAPRFFERVQPRENGVSHAAAPVEARIPIATGLEQLPDDIARTLTGPDWTITYKQGAREGSMFIESSRNASGRMTGEIQLFVGANGELPPLSGFTVEQYVRAAFHREIVNGNPGSYLSADFAAAQDAARAARQAENAAWFEWMQRGQ